MGDQGDDASGAAGRDPRLDDGPLLDVVGLGVTFGGVHALDRVSLTVAPGRIVGLIGPNGAGKTTFIDAVCGFVPHRGTITFAGRRIDRLPSHRRARAGLARTWQTLELFDDLTVAENCLVAVAPGGWRAVLGDLVRPGRHHGDAAVADALAAVGLGDRADARPDELSLGQRKLVGVARALAARPALVLLDEPAAGLDTDESRRFGAHLESLAAAGVAVLLVDHDMGLVLGSCEEVHVLDAGQVIAAGPPAEVRADPAVVAAYLGEGVGG